MSAIGAYSMGHLFNNFHDRRGRLIERGAYSKGPLIQKGRLFED